MEHQEERGGGNGKERNRNRKGGSRCPPSLPRGQIDVFELLR